ncbi:hypothetical protein GCM10009541_47310 [Micromonospora gifhornensis]|uniref:Helix-turn-helix domain-containing protein n=1 Tax=Micromonospora gifhornensis TaxID=84594 RepID=A0ABQ4I6F7_9ACTN|nr:hypothetical protein [Micromonospora gifhornensis]GIJ13467.1 hypothetical protein Vgi01_01510 [Micromonospora gifhornensis]
MESKELKERAQALRSAGQTPKQIARELGVTRAVVTRLVRGVDVVRPARVHPSELPLLGCWISRQWSNGLSITDRPTDWVDDKELPEMAMGAGLVSVMVARAENGGVTTCGFLVDTYCLGVKNALPPVTSAPEEMTGTVAEFFSAYDAEPLQTPLDLARHLVFGAVDYAHSLGFEPHRDFYSAAPHLGAWEPPSRITFGLNGKPYFQQGPHDNPERIMRTLDRTVGRDNYHFTIVPTML